MARRKKQEEHENHERWLVSYADFITLLFAFFVVMYSISSVNEGKYRVLSNSIVSAFNKESKSLAPIQHGTTLRAPIIQQNIMQKSNKGKKRIGVDYQIAPTAEELAKMQKIADEVKANLQKLVSEGLVNVNKTNKGIEIEINSEILFYSGKARLNLAARNSLNRIAGILQKNNSDINIEGFTDNVPINTFAYPSNWELSSARAASVVRLFAKSGITASRMIAVGYGEHKPVASNEVEEGRKKNRRITIMVLNRPRDDRIEIDDRTKEEKEADARRKVMRSFGNKSGKPVKAPVKLFKGPKPIVLGGGSPVKVLRNKNTINTSSNKSTSPTVIGSQIGNTRAGKTSQGKPSVISLPKPTLIQPR